MPQARVSRSFPGTALSQPGKFRNVPAQTMIILPELQGLLQAGSRQAPPREQPPREQRAGELRLRPFAAGRSG